MTLVQPKSNAKKAPGTVTVGVDTNGTPYMYVYGQGKRGRQPLNLSPQQRKVLESRGLKPGSTIDLQPAQLQQLGVNAGAQARQHRYNDPTAKQYTNIWNDHTAIKTMLQSHQNWLKSGDGDAKKRLAVLLGNGRDKWLKDAAARRSPVAHAFGQIVVATMLGKDLLTKDAKHTGKQILFNPGKETLTIGGKTFKTSDISGIRAAYKAGDGTPAPKGHASPQAELKAMTDALNVQKPEKLVGGKGDKKPDKTFDTAALAKGTKVEAEHTKDPALQKEIAKDHLSEDPKYYDKLEKVEKKTNLPADAKEQVDEAAMFMPPPETYPGKTADYNREYMQLMNDPQSILPTRTKTGGFASKADELLHQWQQEVERNPKAEPQQYLEAVYGRDVAMEHFDRTNHARKQYYGYIDKNQRFEDAYKGYNKEVIDAPTTALEKTDAPTPKKRRKKK